MSVGCLLLFKFVSGQKKHRFCALSFDDVFNAIPVILFRVDTEGERDTSSDDPSPNSRSCNQISSLRSQEKKRDGKE